MPIYTPIAPTNDPDYLRYSRGVDKGLPEAVTPVRPTPAVMPGAPAEPVRPTLVTANRYVDQTYETAFKGLASGLGLGATAIDAAMQNKIEDDVRNTYRGVQNSEFGVGEATSLGGQRVPPNQATGSSGNVAYDEDGNPISVLPAAGAGKSQGKGLPPGATGITNQMDKYNALYKQGQVSESYYNSVINSEMAKLQSRYPVGYEGIIEDLTAKYTGMRPPNALVRSLRADEDARARAAAAGQSKELKEIIDAQNKGFIWPTASRDYQAGTLSISDARVHIANREGSYNESQRNHNQKENNQKDLETNMSNNFAQNVRDFTVQQMNNHTFTPEAQGILQSWRAGVTPTPPQMQLLQTEMAKLEKGINDGVSQMVNGFNPWTGKQDLAPGGHSPGSVLDNTKIASIVANATLPWNNYKKAIGIGDFSLAGGIAAQTTLMEDSRTRDFLKDFPGALEGTIITKKLGPNALNLLYTVRPAEMPPMLNGLWQFYKGSTLTAPTTNPQSEDLKKASNHLNSPREKEQFFKQDVDYNTSVLSGTAKADPQMVAQTASTVFHENNNIFDIVAPKNAANLYYQYTSPSVLKQMMKLRDEGGSDGMVAWNRFQMWSASYVPVAIKTDMQDLQRLYQADGRFSVGYNDNEHKLVYVPNAPTSKIQARNAPTNTEAETIIFRVNANLDNLVNISEAGKRDTNLTLDTVFKNLGIDLGPQNQKGTQSTSEPDKEQGKNLVKNIKDFATGLVGSVSPSVIVSPAAGAATTSINKLNMNMPTPQGNTIEQATSQPAQQISVRALTTLPTNQKKYLEDGTILVQTQEGGPWMHAKPVTK